MRIIPVLLLAACSLNTADHFMPSPGTGPVELAVAPCHVAKADLPVQCGGSVASLNAAPLAQGFFSEVSSSVGLTGHYARRVQWGDVNSDRYPDIVGIETGIRRGLQHLYVSQKGERF